MSETTHKVDHETGHYVQVVTPARLREILDADGDTYDRPKDMTDDDEWDVGCRGRKRVGRISPVGAARAVRS